MRQLINMPEGDSFLIRPPWDQVTGITIMAIELYPQCLIPLLVACKIQFQATQVVALPL